MEGGEEENEATVRDEGDVKGAYYNEAQHQVGHE